MGDPVIYIYHKMAESHIYTKHKDNQKFQEWLQPYSDEHLRPVKLNMAADAVLIFC